MDEQDESPKQNGRKLEFINEFEEIQEQDEDEIIEPVKQEQQEIKQKKQEQSQQQISIEYGQEYDEEEKGEMISFKKRDEPFDFMQYQLDFERERQQEKARSEKAYQDRLQKQQEDEQQEQQIMKIELPDCVDPENWEQVYLFTEVANFDEVLFRQLLQDQQQQQQQLAPTQNRKRLKQESKIFDRQQNLLQSMRMEDEAPLLQIRIAKNKLLTDEQFSYITAQGDYYVGESQEKEDIQGTAGVKISQQEGMQSCLAKIQFQEERNEFTLVVPHGQGRFFIPQFQFTGEGDYDKARWITTTGEVLVACNEKQDKDFDGVVCYEFFTPRDSMIYRVTCSYAKKQQLVTSVQEYKGGVCISNHKFNTYICNASQMVLLQTPKSGVVFKVHCRRASFSQIIGPQRDDQNTVVLALGVQRREQGMKDGSNEEQCKSEELQEEKEEDEEVHFDNEYIDGQFYFFYDELNWCHVEIKKQ